MSFQVNNATQSHQGQLSPDNSTTSHQIDVPHGVSLVPASSRVGFLSLPREIRVKIYQEYFRNLYIMINPKNAPGTYDSNNHGTIGVGFAWNSLTNSIDLDKALWPLFLSCSTIFSEARFYLLSEATFVFLSARAFVRSVELSQIAGLPLRLPGQLDIGYYVFGSLKNVWLDCTDLTRRDSAQNRVTDLDERVRNGRDFCRYLQTKLHSIQNLNITVSEHSTFFWPSNHLSTVPIKKHFLKALFNFRNLETFNFAIQRIPGTVDFNADPNHQVVFLNNLLQSHVLRDPVGGSANPRLDHGFCTARVLQLRFLDLLIGRYSRSGFPGIGFLLQLAMEEIVEYMRAKYGNREEELD